jgi:hypothetical protein
LNPSLIPDLPGDYLLQITVSLSTDSSCQTVEEFNITVNSTGLPPGISPTLFGDLVINEVMADPISVSDQDGEWIEVFNPTLTNFDISGLNVRITAGTIQEFSIDTTVIIPAGAFVVIGKTTDEVLNGGIHVDYVADFILPNGAFSIETSNGTTLLDSVSFSATPGGASWQLDPAFNNANDNDDEGNWCPSTFLYGGGSDRGTPGDTNHQCLSSP